MNRFFILIFLLIFSCNTGNLKTIMDIPLELIEVSGLSINKEQNIFWMINDSGNKPILYGLDKDGNIIKEITIRAKNRDWEDLTVDKKGNICHDDIKKSEITLTQFYNYIKNEPSILYKYIISL